MKSSDSSPFLHNLTHLVLPFAVSSIALLINPSFDPYDVLAVALFGGLVPDIDHINIWLEYNFKDFWSFARFVTRSSRRYRYSFLIFHNLGAVFVIVLLIPFVYRISPLGVVFLAAFLAHLLLDFIDDKISIGRVTHWRYRRRT